MEMQLFYVASGEDQCWLMLLEIADHNPWRYQVTELKLVDTTIEKMRHKSTISNWSAVWGIEMAKISMVKSPRLTEYPFHVVFTNKSVEMHRHFVTIQ